MLVIRIELWPKGDERRAREIGRGLIANVGGTDQVGDYEVRLLKSAEYATMADEILREGWLPEIYCDEVTPPPRATPDAWLTRRADGTPALASDDPVAAEDEPGDTAASLVDGEAVPFTRLADHGRATLAIRPDGSWSVSAPMPAAAEQVCALDGFQSETLSGSVEEVVEALQELLGDDAAGDYALSYYTYEKAVVFRFDAAAAAFVRAGPLQ